MSYCMELYFVWTDHIQGHISGYDTMMWKDKTLHEVKQPLLKIVQNELGVPIHEAHIKFWKGKAPRASRITNSFHFNFDARQPPERMFDNWAVPLDESTIVGEFFDFKNPLYIQSTLPEERSAFWFGGRSQLVERISDIYDLLVDTHVPFCAGTCPVSEDKCVVQYRSTDSLKEINLSKATEEELEQLTEACKPAPFGRNNQDVYDESYRKAWKMDGGDYILNFKIEDTDIINTIKSKLVQFDREIGVELYKLNVYGKGSFFKTHKDTPRSAEMFGSLVVVFPTAHEGGVFILRHHHQEWETDFAAMISETHETPSIGFVAFYSDVDHEVKEVTSGYRITLTYNLTFAPPTQSNTPDTELLNIPLANERCEKLARYIEDVSAMDPFQYGGYLAFGLLYQYPVNDRGSVASLRSCLKGQDALLCRIIDKLGLTWNLRICYRSIVQDHYTRFFLSQYVVQFGPYANFSNFDEVLPDAEYVIVVEHSPFESIPKDGSAPYSHYVIQPRKLVPLTPIPRVVQRPSKFIQYGNEAYAGRLYADICLVVDVPAEIPGSEKPPRMAAVEARKKDLDESEISDDSEE